MSEGEERNAAYLTLEVEHLRNAVRYADRGRRVFFDETTPDTHLLVEGELRKAFESLNRLGRSFWRVNPALSQDRIGEIRQLLTHDYTDVDPAIYRLGHCYVGGAPPVAPACDGEGAKAALAIDRQRPPIEIGGM